MPVDFQATSFEPVSFYDAPWTAISQVLEGEATWNSFWGTFLDKGSTLTPKQRQTFIDEWKSATGADKNRVASAIWDVATNPFVIASFFTSPAAVDALRGGGRIYGEHLRSTIPHVLKNGHMLTDGLPAGRALTNIGAHRDELNRVFSMGDPTKNLPGVSHAEDALVEHLGITHREWFEPHLIRDPDKRYQVTKLSRAMEFHQTGRGRKIEFWRPTWGTDLYYEVPTASGGVKWKKINEEDLPTLEMTAVDEATVTAQGFFDEFNRVKSEEILRDLDRYEKRRGALTPKQERLRSYHRNRIETITYPRMVIQEDAKEGARRVLRALDPESGLWLNVVTGREKKVIFDPADRKLTQNRWFGDGVLEDTISEIGGPFAWDWMKAIRAQSLERFRISYLDEVKVPSWQSVPHLADDLARVLDEDKILRTWDSMDATNVQGSDPFMNFLGSMLSKETRKEIIKYQKTFDRPLQQREGMSPEWFKSQLKLAFSRGVRPHDYFPRTNWEFYGVRQKEGLSAQDALKTLRQEPFSWEDGYSITKMENGEWLGARGKRTFSAKPSTLKGETVSSRQHPLMNGDDLWNPGELDEIEEMFGTENLQEGFFKTRAATHQSLRKIDKDGFIGLRKSGLNKAWKNWHHHTANDLILDQYRIGDDVLESMEQLTKNPVVAQWLHQMHGRGYEGLYGENEFIDKISRSMIKVMDSSGSFWNQKIAGGFSYRDVLDQSEVVLRNMGDEFGGQEAARLYRDTLIPTVLGNSQPRRALTRWGLGQAKIMAKKMGNASWYKGVFGEDAAERLRYWADNLNEMETAGRIQHGLAGWIYSSTLGVNMASVLLNSTQPFMHLAAWYGVGPVMKAYKGAIGDLRAYFKLRVARHGIKQITPAQRRQVAQDAGMRYFEEAGIMGSALDDLDRLALSEGFTRGNSKTKFWLQDLPLKPFEKAEWLNRLVAAHATEQVYRKAGRSIYKNNVSVLEGGSFDDRFLHDVYQGVHQSQFGADAMNTPLVFLGGSLDVFRNPLVRQFLTFTMRTPIAFIEGAKIGNRPFLKAMANDLTRAAATGAVFYEVGKNFGLDLERVGAPAAIMDVFGGEDILARERSIPWMIPPFADIGLDFVGGLLGPEKELLGNAISRMIPGGVAIQRALGVLPAADGKVWNLASLPERMQRTYADWENPDAQGNIPLFKGDGTLVEFQSPLQLVMKGIGAPVESHTKAGNFDRYLQQNRDQILRHRQELMNALLSGDIAKAEQVRTTFEKQFGFPLTVSKAQLQNRIKSRTVSRSERMLDRMPVEARQIYMEMAAQDAQRMGWSDPDAFKRGLTISKRRAIVPGYQGPAVPPEGLEEIRQELERERAAKMAGNSYAPFDSY